MFYTVDFTVFEAVWGLFFQSGRTAVWAERWLRLEFHLEKSGIYRWKFQLETIGCPMNVHWVSGHECDGWSIGFRLKFYLRIHWIHLESLAIERWATGKENALESAPTKCPQIRESRMVHNVHHTSTNNLLVIKLLFTKSVTIND